MSKKLRWRRLKKESRIHARTNTIRMLNKICVFERNNMKLLEYLIPFPSKSAGDEGTENVSSSPSRGNPNPKQP